MATISEIQTCINNLSIAKADELLLLAAQTNSLTTDRVVKVVDVNSLPDLATCSLSNGTTVFVEGLNVPVMVANGSWVGLDNRVLRQDFVSGDIWAWGIGCRGRLGDGTTVNKSSPILVLGGFTDWCQVSAGTYHSVGVRINGTAWAWGCSDTGRLGDGTTVDKSSPVSVVGGFTDWCQVSAASSHNLGLRTNGTAWAWGSTAFGRLGDGTGTDKSSPVSVVGGFTDWCQVSAGLSHSLGARTNGTAWAWGFGSQGRLGDGTTVNKSSPVSVIGGLTWCRVSGGGFHSIGITNTGTAWTWGGNAAGQLGDGTTVDKSSPVLVVGGFTDWCQVSAGYRTSLGVRTNGTAWAWGGGVNGRLGDGTTVDKSSPVLVAGGFTDWCQVSAGGDNGLGVRTNGTAWAWGTGSSGQLGDGTTLTKSSPVSVVGGFTDWCQVSSGRAFFSLAIRTL